ncbi:MAG: UDP-N-acetylglucosamine 2-epimerase [Sphingobacteriales bacterium 40-81]|nr:MAG: UDP-N-acetylglucosamine 2-epimerase [Sphingobacteriales bacterium 40-81]
MKKVYIVVGTRPNFIKVTQFKTAGQWNENIQIKIIHTGQHYDAGMSDIFFQQLGLTPDYFLNIRPASPNRQIGEIMDNLETLFEEIEKPDILLVVGDVNSTLAAALCANKLGIKLGHVESGLRSFDRTMPEEINRLITDEITDYFFVTESSGYGNLINEGKPENRIFFVGNTMIDTLVAYNKEIEQSPILTELELESEDYVLMTMHRPATVDCLEGLQKLRQIIEFITQDLKLVFPIHPRTLKNFEKFGLKDAFESNKRLLYTPPLDYFAFQKLITRCKYVITDSGGIQEETTFLRKPCLTLRPNTERPVTVEIGSNTLIPLDIQIIEEFISAINSGRYKSGSVPDKWDGKATQRILEVVLSLI